MAKTGQRTFIGNVLPFMRNSDPACLNLSYLDLRAQLDDAIRRDFVIVGRVACIA